MTLVTSWQLSSVHLKRNDGGDRDTRDFVPSVHLKRDDGGDGDTRDFTAIIFCAFKAK